MSDGTTAVPRDPTVKYGTIDRKCVREDASVMGFMCDQDTL